MSKLKIKRSDIDLIQSQWAHAVVQKNIDNLIHLYANNAVLKPTLSDTIRRTHDDIKSYFIGGGKFYDSGFFNTNIQKIQFVESSPLLLDNFAIDTGVYEFTKNDGTKISAHFTFCYKKEIDETLKILAQHSSPILGT